MYWVCFAINSPDCSKKSVVTPTNLVVVPCVVSVILEGLSLRVGGWGRPGTQVKESKTPGWTDGPYTGLGKACDLDAIAEVTVFAGIFADHIMAI